MKTAITGISRLTSSTMEDLILTLDGRIKEIRMGIPLERLAVAAVGRLLDDAGISFPVGNSTVGLYIGIDDAIEDIKDEYFSNIVKDGILGASPLLFPFTSPNAIAAQISIAFDIRGESITMPIKHKDVIKYSTECIQHGYSRMAVAGGITLKDKRLTIESGRYAAEFFLIETVRSAMERRAKIYRHNGRVPL
jgi:3-oxoacyl-(acyl-carrier-protein) synthase